MTEQFYTILTQIGKAKVANSTSLGTKVNFTHFALGDGNGNYYNPTEIQIGLKNEVWRGQIGQIVVDEDNPNWIVLEAVIPANVGGFMIREAGVFDDEGNMLAIGKYPETYKPVVASGSAKDLYIKMILEVSNTSVVTLKIDPSIILATKKDIDVLSNRITKNTNDIIILKQGTTEIVDLETIDKTLKGAINELDAKVKSHEADMTQLIKIKKNVNILSTGWVDDTLVSGYWINELSDVDITENVVVDVNIHLADLEKASDIKSSNLSGLGKITLYADSEVAEDIICDMKLIRQVV